MDKDIQGTVTQAANLLVGLDSDVMAVVVIKGGDLYLMSNIVDKEELKNMFLRLADLKEPKTYDIMGFDEQQGKFQIIGGSDDERN